MMMLTAQAKKVKVTIDGTVSPTQTTVYLIINEDTEHAQRLTIKDGKFSTKVAVERDAFIRLDNRMEWPERSTFVLIPDSRHITIDWNTGSIEGSQMSQKLQETCHLIQQSSPEGFFVDVFSDDPNARREGYQRANAVRERMMEEQRGIARNVMLDEKNNIMTVWIAYCYPQLLKVELNGYIEHMKPKWANHPLLQKK